MHACAVGGISRRGFFAFVFLVLEDRSRRPVQSRSLVFFAFAQGWWG